MSLSDNHLYEFGNFRLDTKERTLFCGDKSIELTPKAFDLLAALVEGQGKLVGKEELMSKVWPESFVEESNLTFNIRQLRKILNDNAQDPTYIKTVPRHGYRLISPVTVVKNSENGLDPAEQVFEARALVGNLQNGFGSSRPQSAFSPKYLGVLAAVLILGVAAYFLWPFGLNKLAVTESFDDLFYEQIIKSDKYTTASISPDGKYVAYVNALSGRESLWLRHLPSGQSTEIVPAEDGVRILRIKFSRDGEYIYFSRKPGTQPSRLDRVPMVGGVVQTNLVAGPDSHFDISSDASLVSFRKVEGRKSSLKVARIDSGEAKTVFETDLTIMGNSFSPDSKSIAFAVGKANSGGLNFDVFMIGTDGGTPVPATEQKWNYINDVAWLPDNSGLLVTAQTETSGIRQLWKISLPDGNAQKISDTQVSLHHISVSGDKRQVLLSGDTLAAKLYVVPINEPASVQSSAQTIAPAYLGVSWTPGGELVYSAFNGNDDIWRVSPDGSTQKQLTTQNSSDIFPVVSPDGRFIVFVSDRSGKSNLWRMNADGTEPVQLTHGADNYNLSISPDGAFVLFSSTDDTTLWRVPLSGGESSPVAFNIQNKASLSRDGTRFVHFVGKGSNKKIVLETFDKRQVIREYSLPEGVLAGHGIVWSRDGQALYYFAQEKTGANNIWSQPIDGSLPQKITDYDSERIFSFDISPDNSKIALIRGAWNFEIILASSPK